ncbi:hypothetical protein MO867_23490, partial [Microbulbifer sp. OS29]
ADGHADHFWALGLAIEAASQPSAPIEYQSTGRRSACADNRLSTTDTGFGTVAGGSNFGGFN